MDGHLRSEGALPPYGDDQRERKLRLRAHGLRRPPDRFRIKIWDGSQGNGVVYDNELGAEDGAVPTTALGGGSIVIHKK